MAISVEPVKSVEGCEHFRALQRLVWGGEADDMVPNHVTVTVLKNGGALLGAYDGDGPEECGGMVGAVFWWIGHGSDREGVARFKICSHMAGVLPAWQGKGIGLMLKLAQRDLVLEQGLTDWVTWTYDPLQRVNAVFNLHRLGASCRSYLRNVYGVMRDALNAGSPSDRFQVDWHLRSERVVTAVGGRGVLPEMVGVPSGPPGQLQVLPMMRNVQGLQQPVDVKLNLDGAPLAVPIPDDINMVRCMDQGLGLAWRFYTRDMFEQAFGAGYVAVDCVGLDGKGWYYILALYAA
jgi:predicted GNAT superfamily acetyltransferase